MKNSNKIINIIVILTLFCSCEKLIDVGTPTDMLVTESVFRSDETANAALMGSYVRMMSSSLTLPVTIADLTGMYGDELVYHGSIVGVTDVYLNRLNAKESTTNSIWSNGYKFLYNANSIINGLEKSTQVTDAVKKRLLGEAYFIRAFWHFYLLNLYGEIPLITSIDYTLNSTMPRQKFIVVYDGIVSDLVNAKTYLGEEYVAANSISPTTERVRPNKFAASALLSKVYLFGSDWVNAEIESTSVLLNPLYKLEDVGSVFSTTSSEALWQLAMPQPAVASTYEALYFLLNSSPVSATRNNRSLSPRVLKLFSEADLRMKNWVGVYRDETTTPATDFYFPAKYKNQSSEITENSTVIRLAEVYLIRSEARAQQGKLPLAIKDTDVVRERAGLPLISELQPEIDKKQLLDSISRERVRELFCEWGNRWLDIKRSKDARVIMAAVSSEKGANWSDDWLLWPIPLSDIDNNRKLTQNAGYE